MWEAISSVYIRFSHDEPTHSIRCTCFQLQYFSQFTQLKADGEVRWAVLNIAAILKQYEALHLRLALAMEAGKSIGELAEMIDAEVQSAPSLTSS